MRRQNPPQAHLDNAVQIESFLRPFTIITAYAILAAVCVAVIALFFVLFLHEAILAPGGSTMGNFITACSIPIMLAVICCLIRPRDPISLWLRTMAKQWRTPLKLTSQECTFKQLLGDGDGLCVKISLHYPVKNHNPETDERIYLYVKSALSRDCSLRLTTPTFKQVEEAVDPALEILVSECNVSVLYPVVEDIQKVQSDFNFHEGELESAEFWRTGT